MMMMMMMMMMMFITQQRHVMSRDMPDDFAFRLCYVNVVINCLCRCAPYIPSTFGYTSRGVGVVSTVNPNYTTVD